jgi:16S rRNA (adenine1518-N6/adenine1519-N6)-dimethyltransferase
LHQNPKSEIQNPNEIQNSNFKNSEIHSKNLKFKHSSFAYKPPQLIVLTIQKEMADRITAQPGDSNRGILTIMVELLAEAEIVAFVPRSSFYPEPEVDSAVIRLRPRKHLRSGVAPAAHFGGEGIGRALKNSKTKKLKDVDYNLVMHIAKAGFSAKRRQLHNSLSGGLGLSVSQVKNLLQATDIDPQKRAEELTVLEWQEIANEWLKLLRAHRS